MAARCKPGSRPYRDQLRRTLVAAGITGPQLVAQIAADLGRCGMRPRQAWRYAAELSQTQAATRFNEITGNPRAPMRGNRIGDYEKWPDGGVRPPVRALKILAEAYGTTWDQLVDASDLACMPDADKIAYADTAEASRIIGRRTRTAPAANPPATRREAGSLAALWEDDPARRRTSAGLADATTVSTTADTAPYPAQIADVEPLALILTGHTAASPAPQAAPDIAALTGAADSVRRQYQACRYSGLIKDLPDLLTRLSAACHTLDGEARLRAYAISADAHHVAAGLLLKLDDQALACLAADRSMRAAAASDDPVTVGASARIVTHTLMNGGHLAAAIATATSQAARLDRNVTRHNPEALSVYGSLLLRGAIAAAHHDERGTALDLLTEADNAARQLGSDSNLRWTAFGPVNAKLHRVSIAVTLGDAGTAIDIARQINLSAITVTERKASLLIDVARAFLQWGRHEKALTALRAAADTAPEEVAGRPAVHRLISDLLRSAPPSIRQDAGQFAASLGVSR